MYSASEPASQVGATEAQATEPVGSRGTPDTCYFQLAFLGAKLGGNSSARANPLSEPDSVVLCLCESELTNPGDFCARPTPSGAGWIGRTPAPLSSSSRSSAGCTRSTVRSEPGKFETSPSHTTARLTNSRVVACTESPCSCRAWVIRADHDQAPDFDFSGHSFVSSRLISPSRFLCL